MTTIVMGGRLSGKTSYLISESAKTGIYILVANKPRAKHIMDLAKEMGLNIPYPVTVDDYFACQKFNGSSIERDGMYVDDVDDVLTRVFSTVPIKAVSFTMPDQFDGLTVLRDDEKAVYTEGLWSKTNPYAKEGNE